MEIEIKVKAGDTVYHYPSKEKWLVMAADNIRGELMPCGWPCSIAKISDCKLLKSCTDDKSIKMLKKAIGSKTARRDFALREIKQRGIEL